jgi:error-prone DNA polymerase
MGFYQPPQLVQDARKHDVRVEPVDVCVSDWGSKLEWRENERRDLRPGVRLGLREISGFAQDAAERIAIARGERAFSSVEDLAVRAQLSTGDMKRLAAANALVSLSGHRRQAAWQVSGLHRQSTPVQGDLFDAVPSREAVVELVAPKEGENIVADYRTIGLTLGRHPLALLRNKLHARRFDWNADVLKGADRAPGRAAGIVTCRQKPGSAKSVFITIEDETGVINVIVHPWLVERQRREVLSAQLLGVFGQLQISESPGDAKEMEEGDTEQEKTPVVLLVAKRLVDLTPWLGSLATTSRDFH